MFEHHQFSLYQVLHVRKLTLESSEIVKILGPVCSALSYIHKSGYSHGCLTSRCVYLDGWSSQVKLGNIGTNGLIKEFEDMHSSINYPYHKYLPPEAYSGKHKYLGTAEGDIWSIGVILCEMMCGSYPGDMNVVVKMMIGRAIELQPRLAGAIARCTHSTPKLRPNAHDLMKLLMSSTEIHPNRTGNHLLDFHDQAGILFHRLNKINDCDILRRKITEQSQKVRKMSNLMGTMKEAVQKDVSSQQHVINFLGEMQAKFMREQVKLAANIDEIQRAEMSINEISSKFKAIEREMNTAQMQSEVERIAWQEKMSVPKPVDQGHVYDSITDDIFLNETRAREDSVDEDADSETAAILGQVSRAINGGVRTLYGKEISSLSHAFQAADRNGDGRLSIKEFSDALSRLDIGLTKYQMKKFIKFVDKDNDSHIDYEELCRVIESHVEHD